MSASRPAWQAPIDPPAAVREPVIGVDIGVATPARRLNGDPAAPKRTALVAVVALVAIAAVVALAWFISNLGGESGPSSGLIEDNSADAAQTATEVSVPSATSGLNPTRGEVPDVTGETRETALLAIAEAGFVADESEDANDSVPEGYIISQQPAPGTQRDEGMPVFIAVSTGP